MTPNEKYARLAIHLIKGIGPAKFLQALNKFGSAQEILRWLALTKPANSWQQEIKLQTGQASVQAKSFAPGIFAVYGEADYPELLKEIPDPPVALFLKGNRELLQDTASISVVGTRRITAYGGAVTRKFCAELAEGGVCVVSGLAFGVDSLAHETVLANNGKTIAVLGSGIDKAVPLSNWRLFDRISQKGLIISEYYDLPEIAKGTFPRRNRIIAGCSRATLVTEAPDKSGALITARMAFHYDRQVFAVPGNIYSPASAGCNALIRDNIAVSCSDSSQIFADLHLQVPGKSVKNETDLSKMQQGIMEFLAAGPFDYLEIQLHLHLHDRILADGLLGLEMLKKISRDQAGRYFLL